MKRIVRSSAFLFLVCLFFCSAGYSQEQKLLLVNTRVLIVSTSHSSLRQEFELNSAYTAISKLEDNDPAFTRMPQAYQYIKSTGNFDKFPYIFRYMIDRNTSLFTPMYNSNYLDNKVPLASNFILRLATNANAIGFEIYSTSSKHLLYRNISKVRTIAKPIIEYSPDGDAFRISMPAVQAFIGKMFFSLDSGSTWSLECPVSSNDEWEHLPLKYVANKPVIEFEFFIDLRLYRYSFIYGDTKCKLPPSSKREVRELASPVLSWEVQDELPTIQH